jgi:hypothetical protein
MQTIKNDDLEEIRELGSGTYGAVFHGKWRGCDVAIKRIKASCFDGRPSERERLVCFISLVVLNFRASTVAKSCLLVLGNLYLHTYIVLDYFLVLY